MEQFIFEMLISTLRSYLFKTEKIAKYAKYALRARDYLLAFFPLETYPVGGTGDALLENANVKPVPLPAVKEAAKTGGFNIPFIRGM
jgi:hypothetical protein